MGQPNGFQQEYQGFFNGLRNVLQISFSGISLYAYGRIFGSMMLKLGKFIFKKAVGAGRWLLAVLFFNRYATKVLNGVVKEAQNSSNSAEITRLMFRGFLLLGLLGLAVLFFMLRGTLMDEEEAKLMQKVRIRRTKREQEIEKLNKCTTSLSLFFNTI